LLLLLLCSCASERYVQGRSKPEIIETGYNLIRAKLNKLGVLDKVEVFMDSSRCTHSKGKNYYGSWFNELFDIGEEEESISYDYVLQAVGKPYFNSWERFHLNSPRNIYEVIQVEYWQHGISYLCKETIPDTALNRVWIDYDFLQSLNPDFVPMQFEEALAIARKTLNLDTTVSCFKAVPRYEKLKPDDDKETPIWGVTFRIVPSDTLRFYQFAENSSSTCQEIIDEINKWWKSSKQFYYHSHDYLLGVRVHATHKRVISASIYCTSYSDIGIELPEGLRGVDVDYRNRIRKWSGENAEYLKSIYPDDKFNYLWFR
jgi:hypothetical protein